MAIPLKDALLVPWSNNFDARINASPTTYGLTAAQALAYTTANDPYIASYNTMMQARADGTRSQAQTAAKNADKEALLVYARELYAFISANTTVSDADKVLLGIHVRTTGPSPVPAPTERPVMDVVSTYNRTVRVSIHGTTAKRKPEGALQAYVYSYVGETYPSDPSTWQFEGAASKPTYDVTFSDAVANGSQVWICAAWANRKGQTGPVSVPVSTNLQGGGTSAAELRMAA